MLTPAADLSPKGLKVRRWAIAIDLVALGLLVALPYLSINRRDLVDESEANATGVEQAWSDCCTVLGR
jgi:hypothetical protein